MKGSSENNWKINTAIAICFLVIAAYSAELVLFISFQFRFSPNDIDMRTRHEVLEDLRNKDVDAWPPVRPVTFIKSNGLLTNNNRIFPLGGISQKTIVYCNEDGRHNTLESDEHGFYNPKGLYKKDVVTVALVGDYFAFGRCGMSGEDLGSRLRNMGLKIINLENGNNGPLTDLAMLKEYVEAVRPRIVLWAYFEGNDLRDLGEERTSSMLMHYLDEGYSQNLLERQDEIDTMLMEYVAFRYPTIEPKNKREDQLKEQKILLQTRKEKSKIISLWHLRNRLGLINYLHPAQTSGKITNYKSQLPLFSEILAAAHKRTLAWGGELYFVYIPAMDRYVTDNDNAKGALFDRDDVLTVVHKLGIPVIDFHNVLSKIAAPLSFNQLSSADYSPQSYELVSELIIGQLKKGGLLHGE